MLAKGDAADTLRRRITLFRRYLSEGVEAGLAIQYLDQIKRDEADLVALEQAPIATPRSSPALRERKAARLRPSTKR